MSVSNAKYCSQAVINEAGVTVPPGACGRLTLVGSLQSYMLLREYPPGYRCCPCGSTGPFQTLRTTASCAAVRQFVVTVAEHLTELRLNFSSQARSSSISPDLGSHAFS